MLHPDTDLRPVHRDIGQGVVATRLIRRGTLVWVRDGLDQVLSPERVAAAGPAARPFLAKYCYTDFEGNLVLCWDHGRFENHSCDPSTLAVGRFECDIAVRDIHPGDEITCDYAELNQTEPMECRCQSDRCRGVVSRDDLARDDVADRHDDLVRSALELLFTVDQPLWDLLEDNAALRDVAAGHRPLESCRSLLLASGGSRLV